MFLIPCPKCRVDVLVPAERIWDRIQCDWCRHKFSSDTMPGVPTANELTEHLQQRGRMHATTLWGMAASNLLTLAMCFQIPLALYLREEYFALAIYAALLLSHLLGGGVMILAAVAIRRAHQHGLCVLATVLTMMPGCSVLFPLGVLTGMPVLRFLLRPEVKHLYRMNTPGYDPDAE